ncbi:ribosomal L7Ae/L30e/S12e/Gadd45 family protein [candidate division KSB1 bacterium]|nr:ribosomal L7Ae/L30e/S12e/Gadd45 family protein [candidate division KSB1 bacterium]
MIPTELTNLLGLVRRARKIVIGTESVRRELLRQNVELLIFAEDFSASSKRQVVLTGLKIREVTIGTKDEWGEFWGKQDVGVFGILDKNFAEGILKKFQETKSESEK